MQKTKNRDLAKSYVKENYLIHSESGLMQYQNIIGEMLASRQIPIEPMHDAGIELFLAECSNMDSNNFAAKIGVGEREGRIISPLVAKRNYHMSHGIGRSGDIAENQPKACGSSLLQQLSNSLVNHAIQLAGCKSSKKSVILPVCTGMCFLMTLLALKTKQNDPEKNKVIWCRCDQKSVPKSIIAAGFELIVVEPKFHPENDFVQSSAADVEELINKHGVQKISCVITTTSCFAPRKPDPVVDIAKICKNLSITHIINNAYGVQARDIMNAIETAMNTGKVDCFIQSTDKNFLVPVGGGVISSKDKDFLEMISKAYPGRASIGPSMDILITLLGLGQKGWLDLLKQRESLLEHFYISIKKIADSFGERILGTNPFSESVGPEQLEKEENEEQETGVELTLSPPSPPKTFSSSDLPSEGLATSILKPLSAAKNKKFSSTSALPSSPKKKKLCNPISFAMTLDGNLTSDNPSEIGSKLFWRSVTGPRVVAKKKTQKFGENIEFQGYGSSFSSYPYNYMTMACSIGMTKQEIDTFCERLNKILTEKFNKISGGSPKSTIFAKGA